MTTADQRTAQRISDEVDELIASFSETYAKMAELEQIPIEFTHNLRA